MESERDARDGRGAEFGPGRAALNTGPLSRRRFLAGLTLPAALALPAGVLLAACTPDDGVRPGASQQEQQSTAPFNRADETFVTKMLPRDRMGIDLSENVLAKPGLDEVTSSVAGTIRDTQTAEEQTFTAWLTDRKLELPDQDDDPGPLSWEEMQAVTETPGDRVRKPYFVAMIANHLEVVDLANEVIDAGADPDLRAMAQDIITTREAEIDEMQRYI